MKLVYVEGEITGRNPDSSILSKGRVINADLIESIYPDDMKVEGYGSNSTVVIETKNNHKYAFVNTCWLNDCPDNPQKAEEIQWEVYNRLVSALQHQEDGEVIKALIPTDDHEEIKWCYNFSVTGSGDIQTGFYVHYLFDDSPEGWNKEGISPREIGELKSDVVGCYKSYQISEKERSIRPDTYPPEMLLNVIKRYNGLLRRYNKATGRPEDEGVISEEVPEVQA